MRGANGYEWDWRLETSGSKAWWSSRGGSKGEYHLFGVCGQLTSIDGGERAFSTLLKFWGGTGCVHSAQEEKIYKIQIRFYQVWAPYHGRKSYADVVRGKGPQPNSVRTIKVQKGANGWLYESAVVRLKAHLSVAEFQDELQRKGYGDIKVRVGGGRQLVLSFQSMGAMREKLSLMKDWLTNWCELIEKWDESMAFDQRVGRVLEMDAGTMNMESLSCGKVKIETRCMDSINLFLNLDCQGVLYPVRISEEQIIVPTIVKEQCICQSFLRNNETSYSSEDDVETIADRGSSQGEEDGELEIQVGAEVDVGG
ncbi:hypothetical protein ACSBR1_040831 [Camellia fascicularis]